MKEFEPPVADALGSECCAWIPNRDREEVTMGLRPTNGDEDAGKSRSPVAYARGSEPKESYRAATVRESVPLSSKVSW